MRRYTCGKCGQQGHSKARCKTADAVAGEPALDLPKERIVIGRDATSIERSTAMEIALIHGAPEHWHVMLAHGAGDATSLALAMDAEHVFYVCDGSRKALVAMAAEGDKVRAVHPAANVVVCLPAPHLGELDVALKLTKASRVISLSQAIGGTFTGAVHRGREAMDEREPEEKAPPKQAEKRKTGGGTWLWAVN